VAIHGTNVALMMENLGDLAGAEARQRRSLEIHTSLAEADPESAQARDDVAYVQAALASVLLRGARLAPAAELARLAVEGRRRLVAEDPTNAESRYRLARTYALAGRIRERQGDGGAACEAYRQAAETLAPVEGQVVVSDQHLGVALEKRDACSI
jgi:tetratricopeptide (TPR) repeat protein